MTMVGNQECSWTIRTHTMWPAKVKNIYYLALYRKIVSSPDLTCWLGAWSLKLEHPQLCDLGFFTKHLMCQYPPVQNEGNKSTYLLRWFWGLNELRHADLSELYVACNKQHINIDDYSCDYCFLLWLLLFTQRYFISLYQHVEIYFIFLMVAYHCSIWLKNI